MLGIRVPPTDLTVGVGIEQAPLNRSGATVLAPIGLRTDTVGYLLGRAPRTVVNCCTRHAAVFGASA